MTKNRDISNILDQNTTFTATVSVGSGTANVFANSTVVKVANSTVNTYLRVPTTTEYAGNYYLHANGTWQLVSAGATPGGSNTYVQFNDSTALGGTAGFTFDKATNNAVIANTLTVGTATINSTNYSQTANNALNLGGTAAAGYQTTAGLAANVLVLAANNATWHGTSVFANSTGAYPTSNTVGNIFGNTLSRPVIVGNSATFSTTLSVTTGITGPALTANTLGLYPTSNSVGQNLGNTTARWDIALIGQDANTTGIYPLSNTSGQKFGNTISRWEIWANTINVVGVTTLAAQMSNSTGLYPTSNTVGQMLGNTTARWDIALVGQDVYSSGMFPLSNTSGQLLGNTISRFTLVANSVTVSSGVSPDSNTLGTALGTTTQRWVITANSLTTTGQLANSLGLYPTSNTVGQLFGNTLARWDITYIGGSANSTGLYPISNTSGQAFGNTLSRWIITANSLTISGALNANGTVGTNGQALISNGTIPYWGTVTASAAAGGSNTQVQFNDSTAMGGSAGFTFDKTTNNVFFANTLTSGNSTVNSVANSTTLLLSNSSTETISANSAALAIGNSTVNNTLNSVCIAINVSPTANLTSNTVIVQLANASGTSNLTPVSLAIATSFLANSLGIFPGSNTSGDSLGNTTARWDASLGGQDANSTGFYPVSNTVGQALGNTISRWTPTFIGQSANSLGFYPVSNTVGQLLGNTIARFAVSAMSVDVAAGNSTVAPVKLVSGTNLTTPAAGAMEFDGTVPYFTSVASSRMVVDCEQFITLTSAFTLTSQTGAQKMFNAPAGGALTIETGKTYFFECMFSLTTLSATSGSYGWDIKGAGGATLTRQAWFAYATKETSVSAVSVMGANATVAPVSGGSNSGVCTSYNTALNLNLTQATTGAVGKCYITGKIVCGGTGTIIPSISQTTASAAVVGNDSFFRIRPVGTNTVQSVGNWA